MRVTSTSQVTRGSLFKPAATKRAEGLTALGFFCLKQSKEALGLRSDQITQFDKNNEEGYEV